MARTQTEIERDMRINAMFFNIWEAIPVGTQLSEAMIALHRVGAEIASQMLKAELKHKSRRKEDHVETR